MELVEKECTPGGNLNNWFQLFPDRKQASALRQLLQQQVEHPSIRLHTDTVPVKIERQDARHYAMELDNGARLEGNALLVTTGFRTFDASRKEEYGYGIYENVITSVELENYFANRQILTSTGKRPERIGLIQCVGSRDEKMCNFHCSKVCCITAIKQAIEQRAACQRYPNAYAGNESCNGTGPHQLFQVGPQARAEHEQDNTDLCKHRDRIIALHKIQKARTNQKARNNLANHLRRLTFACNQCKEFGAQDNDRQIPKNRIHKYATPFTCGKNRNLVIVLTR